MKKQSDGTLIMEREDFLSDEQYKDYLTFKAAAENGRKMAECAKRAEAEHATFKTWIEGGMSKQDIAIDHITQTGNRQPTSRQATTTMPFVTKDSGTRDKYETGCQRDQGGGKGRYDLIPARPLRRLAQLYERGAAKYDDNNWRKGMPFLRVIESMERHLEQFKDAYVLGEDLEDHLAAVAWNAFTLMEYEEAIHAKQLPASLDNRFRYPSNPL